MKKSKVTIVLLLVFSMALGMYTGCGKKKTQAEAVTAESLIEKAEEAIKGAASMTGKMAVEMSMDYSAGGVDAVLEMIMNQDMELTKDPEAVHMTGTLDINLSGITMDTEAYAVKDGDKYVVYTKAGGQWVKQTAEAMPAPADVSKTLELMKKDTETLKLSGPEKSDEKQVYQVDAAVHGEGLAAEIMNSVGNLLEENTDAYADLDAKITARIDSESGALLEMTIDLTDSYNALMQTQKEAQGFDEVAVTAFKVTMTDYALNTVSEITVPDDIKSGAVDMDASQPETSADETQDASRPSETETSDPEEPSSKDYEIEQDSEGNYLLGTDWDDNTVTISVPAGFSYDEGSDKTYLKYNDEKNDNIHQLSLVYGLYTIDENYGEEDLAQFQESSYAYMLSVGDYSDVTIEPMQTVSAAGRTVSYTKLSYVYMGTSYCEEYNSWTVLEDGRMVQCLVTENGYGEPCNRINPGSIFETVYSALKG